MSFLLALAGLAQAAQTPPPAAVHTPGTAQFEVQCMVALNQSAAQQQDPQARMQMTGMAMFYTARVDLLAQQDAQLTQAVQAAMNGMAGQTLGAITQACAQHMGQRLGRFQRLAQQAEAAGE